VGDRTNRKVVLLKRPEGDPTPDCFRVEEEDVAAVGEGQVLVDVECLSIDPFIRTSLNEVSYHQGVPIGGTVVAMGVGRVRESEYPDLAAGDAVIGPLGAQSLALVPGPFMQKLDEKAARPRAYLGVLGMTAGLTAYFGIRGVGHVKPGETVVVSTAAGAVGSLAAQIAKLEGGRVIGIAGGPDKCAYATGELGLDACIDYKAEDVEARLRELAPDGIDVYFDNVGGELLDVVLDQIAEGARLVICGAISQYGHMDDVRGPKLYLRLAERHARMEGFAVTHFRDRFPEGLEQLTAWVDAGQLSLREHIEPGIESFPRALGRLFDGSHIGKLLLEVRGA